jgi:GTP-binding protein Era|tara:strand:- start:766 stop:1602 length:837 start_codon:yes stop_codon:yes gene_type:complete
MKSGVILLIGPTNSGKSTLLNKIIGKRVSLVSRKKQSTTFNQKAVKNLSEAEIVLQDTPGIFSSTKKISNKMSTSAIAEIETATLIYLVLDISKKIEPTLKKIIKTLNDKVNDQKIFLILNKTDKISRSNMLLRIKNYKDQTQLEDIFPISALNGEGISDLLNLTKKYLPNRKQKYSRKKTLLPKKELFYSEITREKIYDKIHKEIPYQCKVHTESIKKTKNEITIHQRISVSKKSHKNILIGKRGSALKEIGLQSRREIAKFENMKTHLFLFVKLES